MATIHSKKGRKLTCSTPNGPVTRTTHRTYTHAVVILKNNGTAEGLSWCGNERLAAGQLRYWKSLLTVQQLDGMAIEVFPVDSHSEVD